MSSVFGNSGSGFNTSQQQTSNPFGTSTVSQNKPNPFASLTTGVPATTQPAQASSLFGSTLGANNQQPAGGLFGNPQQPQQQQSGGFGTLGSHSVQQPAGGLFGNPQQPQQQQSGGFGTLGSHSVQQPASGLFGNPQQPQQPQQQQSGGFGTLGSHSVQQPQQQGGSGLLGGPKNNTIQAYAQQQQQQQQGTTSFGTSSLFANLGNNTNQQSQQQPQQQQSGGIFQDLNTIGRQQQQPQQQQQSGSLSQGLNPIGQQQQQQFQQPESFGQSRLFQQSEVWPRPKSVVDQIEVAFAKWNPESPITLFQTYLYNYVPPDQAPFHIPGPQDDEAKWEEALRKKPFPGAIPVSVRGFQQLSFRMKEQVKHLSILQGRLHEINDGLEALLRRHDLQISTRAAECRRKHVKLSHQCLRLAAKVQVLRNRGYAMDSAEEELRKKLLTLEQNVLDPGLDGRGEEIWARMVSVRERGRQLHKEYEKAGKSLSLEQGQGIDEEVLKRATKILEDYHLQLSHLAKELAQIQKDYAEWEQGKPLTIPAGSRR